ncbi:MAG: PKD domain-containing protein [Candidatus Paceibacterota bacterium]|jgi:hypothetical protein
MGVFFRKLFTIALVGALCYFGYLAYVRWWDGSSTFSEKKQAVQDYVVQKTGETTKKVEEKAKEYSGEVVSEAKQTVLGYVKEKISAGLASVGRGIVNSAESLLGASSTTALAPVTISSIAGGAGNALQAPVGSEYFTPAPPATFVTKVGVPVVFSINRGTSYSITWGDSKIDEGTVAQELIKLVSHTWEKEGDFSVKVSVKGNGVSQTYTFPIRVYP